MWDERIDDVARRLTATPPRADLRARVLARIETGGRLGQRFRAWKPAPIAAGIAVIVFALLRAGWHSHQTPPPAAGTQSNLTEKTPTNIGSAPPANVEMTAVPSEERTARRAPAPGLGQTDRAQQALWQDLNEDSIKPVAVTPLALEALRLDRIKPPEMIQPRALAVEPISVAPLAVDEFRND